MLRVLRDQVIPAVLFSFLLLAPTDYAGTILPGTAIALKLAVHPTSLELVGDNPKRHSTFRAFPLVPALQLVQSFPDIALFSIVNKLLEDPNTRLATNEQLDATRVTNDIGFLLLGFPFIKALSAKGAGEPAYRARNKV